MNDKRKPAAAKPQVEHTIRKGEIMVTIVRRQSNCGFVYLDYSLARAWQAMTSGKENFGDSFFDRNESDLVQAVREASQWIRNRTSNTRPVVPPSPGDGASDAARTASE
jgi:hypothetical protein